MSKYKKIHFPSLPIMNFNGSFWVVMVLHMVSYPENPLGFTATHSTGDGSVCSHRAVLILQKENVLPGIAKASGTTGTAGGILIQVESDRSPLSDLVIQNVRQQRVRINFAISPLSRSS